MFNSVKLGKKVHVPASAFPTHTPPESGFWVGKTVATKKGGLLDVGIKIAGEEVFTRPQSEVSMWLV